MALSNVPVSSSAINQMLYDYDDARETGLGQLIVTFKDDKTYEWPQFPYTLLNEWTSAGSLGTYFNLYIRGRY